LKKDCHAVATLVSDSTNSQNGLLYNRWIASRESKKSEFVDSLALESFKYVPQHLDERKIFAR
jgi:hypothetical protein